jgi:uncharacterized membrane protein
MMSDTTQANTGLSDNAAGAIAYITFIPAIVFLAMPPYNTSPYVRFHAWQSIFFSIVAFVFYVALTIISMVGMFFAPFLMGIVHLVLFLALFLLWILCVIQAVNGKMYQLPLIGGLAAQQANK